MLIASSRKLLVAETCLTLQGFYDLFGNSTEKTFINELVVYLQYKSNQC